MTNKGILTKQNITEKSLQVFSVKGYFNTSINDILEATGLTKGGLYGHFASKEDIWYSVYGEAVKIWRNIAFKNTKNITNPLERIEVTIENHLENYLGKDVFDGGCFFVNMLVEISGQSDKMSRHILRGFVQFSRLLQKWLEDADDKGLLKGGLNHREISNFIIISLNGAATLYSASKDTSIWVETITQMRFYINQLKR
ncbi:MAG: TetR/AcrR family transcriptional regulator [Deltaproteobacteria bacterium]|nr:TetR/AcrR family transcriptional regulator [Deltaproteobacteria bacterium]MBW2117035.1 TetR/AcrR family transcriptional regulator [Deltaproteobacteria bacterium]MBW2342708.1 TetR/AcrR family transcriptional regulator [Deltaproteobacteria bacterium]